MPDSSPIPALSDWQLHTAHRSQDVQLRALFAQVFGHVMSQQEWDWKYQCTDLRGSLLTKSSTAEVVAFFGGMPRTFSHQGHNIQAVQTATSWYARKNAEYSHAKALFTRLPTTSFVSTSEFRPLMPLPLVFLGHAPFGWG